MGFLSVIDSWVSTHGGSNEKDVQRLRELATILDERIDSSVFSEIEVVQNSGRSNRRQMKFVHAGSTIIISPSTWAGFAVYSLGDVSAKVDIAGSDPKKVVDAFVKVFAPVGITTN